jgi:TatD family-associated radical SAM protein
MSRKKSPCVVYWLGNNLYLNITNKCSNNCYFCLRNFTEGISDFKLKLEKDPSISYVIDKLQEVINLKYWQEIVFCGFGEPLERLDCVLEICKWIRKNYGKIVSLRIDTNGQGFLLNKNREVTRELKEVGVDKISVSLNAYDNEVYAQICRPVFTNPFESILEFIKKARETFDVEITAVAIPEIDITKMKKIARKMGVEFRIRRYIPCSW